jgi:hypothetical protein
LLLLLLPLFDDDDDAITDALRSRVAKSRWRVEIESRVRRRTSKTAASHNPTARTNEAINAELIAR